MSPHTTRLILMYKKVGLTFKENPASHLSFNLLGTFIKQKILKADRLQRSEGPTEHKVM